MFQSKSRPSLRLELCGIASTSIPCLRTEFRYFQRSSGLFESTAVNGFGAWSALKITLRCMWMPWPGEAVHS